jgi:ATP phosphoribosyltransferase
MQLGFGKCRLSLLVPDVNKDARPADYAGHRIVTSFPEVGRCAGTAAHPAVNVAFAGPACPLFKHTHTPSLLAWHPQVAKAYFAPLDAAAGVKTSIKFVSGSVEAACKLGLADAVIDLVETGTTMRAAGLVELVTLIETQESQGTPRGGFICCQSRVESKARVLCLGVPRPCLLPIHLKPCPLSLFCQAVLISNPHSTHRELITMLKARIKGHLDSTK